MRPVWALWRSWVGAAGVGRVCGRSQSMGPFWTGVWGGRGLPHLRAAIWRNLALAEAELRRGEELAVERLDFDGDGAEELWIHSGVFSAVVSPERGGVIEEYTVFEQGVNYADVLTRRRESYHEPAPGHAGGDPSPAVDGTPGIHEPRQMVRLQHLAPV